jgi:hypothetical protein
MSLTCAYSVPRWGGLPLPNARPSTQPDLLSIRQTKPGCQIAERYFNTKIADEYSVAFFKCIHPGMVGVAR